VALFNFSNRWMREMVLQAAPPVFDVQFLDPGADGDKLRHALGQADFLVTIESPADWVRSLARCRLVQLQGVGYDAVDCAALREARIPLAMTPEGTVVGVAEHTIMFILALYKRLIEVHASVRRGEFDKVGWRSGCHFLQGKTVGIVGFGRIGRRVAHLARAFQATVVYSDVQRAAPEIERELAAAYLPLDELLEQADVVSVHTPLTAHTRLMFREREFVRMKRGALFINTSRGETYDMDALCHALRSGRLGGAGLDVFNPQPPPQDHPLLQLPNVICTPHMATGTVEAHLEKARAQFENFARVLRGEAPLNLVQS
jgi:phosphoglycerate dehydrogenase-like enzyme